MTHADGGKRYVCLATGAMKEVVENTKQLREWVMATDYDAMKHRAEQAEARANDFEDVLRVSQGQLAKVIAEKQVLQAEAAADTKAQVLQGQVHDLQAHLATATLRIKALEDELHNRTTS